MSSSATVVCPVCGALSREFAPGPGGRTNATCLGCGSLERHRYMALLLGSVVPHAARTSVVLDVAPSRRMSPLIRDINPDGYLSIDFDPDADGRLVDMTASLTDLPFDAYSVGLLVCYHVLEHIPDDRKAMSEIARVLRNDGLALVQVPWRRDSITDEDPDASPEERSRRFGQGDHVRWYGSDFIERMQDSGLSVAELQPRDVTDEWLLEMIGGVPDETFWLCATDPSALPDAEEIRRRQRSWVAARISQAVTPSAPAPAALAAADPSALAAAKADAAKWKKESKHWKKQYRSLRSRTPVRVLARLSRLFR